MQRSFSFGTALVAALLLASCASDTMKGYLGKTVADVILDYGPPAAAFDVGGGRRAFVWTMNTGFVIPGTAQTQGNVMAVGNSAFYSSTTTVMPAQTVSYQCSYAGFAERIPGMPDGPAAWRFVEFKKPRLMCE